VPKKGRENVPQVAVDGTVVRAYEIPNYCTNEFFRIFSYWQITKLLGCPNGNGWANEDVNFVEAYMAFEGEQNKMESEEMEKRTTEMKRQSAGRKGRRG